MMEITAKNLKEAMSHLQNAVAKKTTMPVLKNIAIKAQGDEVVFTANDTKQQITFKTECSNGQAETTIEFDKLQKWSSKFKDDQVLKFKQASEEQINIACGRNRAKFKSLPVSEFPFNESVNGSKLSFNGSDLVDAIKKVSTMTASNDVRYYLNGVALDVKGDKCIAVATNGHRMIKTDIECVNESGIEKTIIIPNESVAGFIKCLDEQPVSMTVADNTVCFSDEVVSYQTTIIDGKFPDYTRVIPQDNPMPLRFNCAELKESVNRAVVFGDGKNTAMRMTVNNNNECNIVVKAPDNTEADEMVSVVASGEIELGMNAQYLTDAINKVETEEITLMVKDANSAVRIDDVDTVMVVMPVRL